MTKPEKKALVPALRFPEFRDAGEWKAKNIGSFCDILQGYGFPETMQGKQEGKYPFCKVSDISKAVNEKGGLLNDAANYVDSDDLLILRAKPLPVGTTVFAKIGEALRLNRRAITTVECLIDNNAVGLKAKPNIAQDYFIFNLSQKIDLNEYCGGAVPSVNKATLENIKSYCPTLPEQQKIADCLSSLDDLITAQTQKLAALKAHKKGLMQQLFPAEGETVPKLRFPEFRDGGEWNVATIDDISSVSSGGTPSRAEPEYWNGDIPWVSTTLIDFNTIENANEYITNAGLKNSSAKVFPKGTILMAMYGQGKTRGKVALLGVKASINQACAAISLKEGINTEFVFQNLASRYDEIRQISNQGGQENLSAALIKKIPLSYPDPESGEQQKIADCLSSVDELITAQSQKIDALKLHKKGLMQQLFPSMDEDNHPPPAAYPSRGGELRDEPFPSSGGVDSEAGRGGSSPTTRRGD